LKKVLIIAHFFPPFSSVGSQRPFGLAKHLQDYGWEPIVLTAKVPGRRPDGIKIIETEYKDIKEAFRLKMGLKLKKHAHNRSENIIPEEQYYPPWKRKTIKLLKEIILFPDEKKGWYSFAYKKALELLNLYKFEAIISTSPPEISHIIASQLKKKFDINWIADFRDPWSQKFSNRKSWLVNYFERRMEIKTISNADLLVSVTKPYADRIKELHMDKRILCITNGFNNHKNLESPKRLTSKFTITYTGYLYRGKRDPSILFEAFAQLLKQNKISRDLIEIKFYGRKEAWLAEVINQFGLAGVVTIHGYKQKDEILKIQRESQLLLLIRWSSKKDMGDCPAKIYEYMYAKRPIIAIGGCGGIIEKLLEETNAGKFADNIETLKTIIYEYYKEFLQNGAIKCKSNNNVNNYSYSSIAKKYSEALESLTI
jgi:phage pi2 protein 07